MSPPGKKSGRTTKASVVNAKSEECSDRGSRRVVTAWSSRALEYIGLVEGGQEQPLNQSAVIGRRCRAEQD